MDELFHHGLHEALERHFAKDEGQLPTRVSVSDIYFAYHRGRASGIDSRRAITTLREGRVDGWRHPSGHRTLLGLSPAGSRDHATVLIANDDRPNPSSASIDNAWRLYDADPSWTPTQAFAEVLLRYGLDFRLGDSPDVHRFVAKAIVPDAVNGEAVVHLQRPGDRSGSRSMAFQHGETIEAGPPAEIVWLFAIDQAHYAVDVERLRA